MSQSRTYNETLADDAVLLTLWTMALEESENHETMGELKAMKLAFLLGYELYQSKIKGLNFEFYRYDWGPMAKEFYVSTEHYRNADLGYLDKGENLVIVQDEGRELAKCFEEEVLKQPENEAIYRDMRLIAAEYGPLSQGEVMDRIYSKRVYTLDNKDRLQTIASIPHHKRFTAILQPGEAVQELQISPGWLITLELSSSREAKAGIRAGIADMKAGRVHPMEEFLANL